MKKPFAEQLEESLFIHYPLKADESKTVEARAESKPVLHSTKLWDGASCERWQFKGDGKAEVKPGGILSLTTCSTAEHWPDDEVRAVNAQSGDYATFGSYVARLDVRGLDMSRGNRIRFQIRPSCDGLHSPIVRVAFVNNGRVKIPDAYSREGYNAINLKNFQWNTCFWEIESIAHDCIEEVSFEIHRYGKEVSAGNELCFELRYVEFEQIERPNVSLGWQCEEEGVIFSTSGYWADGIKTAVANTEATEFQILDAATGEAVFNAPIQKVTNRLGSFSLLDFSELTTVGSYKIHFGNTTSEAFCLSETPVEEAIWKLINFLYCERCGCPIPNKHGACHGDVIARHKGLSMAYDGGWHDAADVSQQSVQSAEVLHSLLEVAEAVKGSNKMLYSRLMEEANWGLDFILRTRFGDGYRATSASIRRWTDSLIGNMDDCEAEVHNHSFENFIIAGVEAEAALSFADGDPELSWKCMDAAKQDFAFALERFEQVGLEQPVLQEHVACASLSQYYAAACWAAAKLYSSNREDFYARQAERFADKLLACQETGELGLPLSGFFFRDENKKAIVHFSHQSRDQIFAQALTEACKALPQSPLRALWEAGMRLYGDYLKGLTQYTAPYGMLPAGVFAMEEIDDAETFSFIHPRVDYCQERENYKKQLEGGIKIADGYYVKCFPVWFSYRGNSAMHLSMGKAASLLGNYFEDNGLIEIAREQLYWTLGKNPSGQSLIYGEGSNYGQQYAALLGETVGEMPVGIQTLGNGDEPYWPQANIATYREVWTTPPARWLWIAADLLMK